MFYKSVTLLQMDIESCAKILVIVLNKGSRVSFTELAQLVPECNSVKIFPQLRDIAGVVFLESEPSGISLTGDLRAELSSDDFSAVSRASEGRPAAVSSASALARAWSRRLSIVRAKPKIGAA
jgi:hypothetical protein